MYVKDKTITHQETTIVWKFIHEWHKVRPVHQIATTLSAISDFGDIVIEPGYLFCTGDNGTISISIQDLTPDLLSQKTYLSVVVFFFPRPEHPLGTPCVLSSKSKKIRKGINIEELPHSCAYFLWKLHSRIFVQNGSFDKVRRWLMGNYDNWKQTDDKYIITSNI